MLKKCNLNIDGIPYGFEVEGDFFGAKTNYCSKLKTTSYQKLPGNKKDLVSLKRLRHRNLALCATRLKKTSSKRFNIKESMCLKVDST